MKIKLQPLGGALAILASLSLCGVAFADGPRGSAFSSSAHARSSSAHAPSGHARTAPARSFSERPAIPSRSFAAGSHRSFSAAPNRNVSPGPGRAHSRGPSAARPSFSGHPGGHLSTGGNTGLRGDSRPDVPSFGSSNALRSPGFNRLGVGTTPPISHPRPGFRTTTPNLRGQPAFGTARPGFATRPDRDARPGFGQRPDLDFRPGGDRSRSHDRPNLRDGQPAFAASHRDWKGGHRFSHPGFVHRPGAHHHHRRHWPGGYWQGNFWPRVHYRTNFVTFFPVLPAFYTTFWFGGIPYYYVDNLYYTWSPDRYGYVVTDPPPALESSTAEYENAATSDDEMPVDSEAGSAGTEAEGTGPASVYIYPRNGQSEEQTAQDRYECHLWAVSQTGFDPTTATGDALMDDRVANYRRALIACLDGRGYSAR